jgi:hypothetical protein
MIRVKVQGGKELEAALRRYSKAVGMDAEDCVKEYARTGSRALAMRTEPMGLSGKAKQISENAVGKDISRAYSSTARTYNELRKVSPRKARAYGAAIEMGDFAAAEKIVRSALPDFRDVESTDSGSHLESLRNSKGRVDRAEVVNLVQEGAVSEIRKEKMRTAGYAKAAWLQSGESIGAKTRIPAWLRKSKTAGRSSFVRRGWSSVATLFNLVRYASNVLPDGKLRAALRTAGTNMQKRIAKVLEKGKPN